MKLISHRVNTVKDLLNTPKEYGAEIDIRYHKDDLILTHDPFHHHENDSCHLETFLENWNRDSCLILNVKTEGIEAECIRLMNKFKVKNWFFLDLSMPYFVKYARLASQRSIEGFGPENLAVRFSDHEPIEYALAFSHMAKWVWVDWFDQIPLNAENIKKFQASQFSLCLVSPELQGKGIEKIADYKKHLADQNISVEAVCTKRPDLWS